MLLYFVCVLLASARPSEAAEATRLVFTRQGPVRGLRINVRPDLGLSKVDAFYGLPYASPPTGQFRFMPPMSPQSWSPGVREAVEMPPVCPQVIPDLSDKAKALRYMAVGRYDYLTKLFQHLKYQSEDCLYLNIYTPTDSAFASAIGGGQNGQNVGLPVFVFIHGESYEWNSGNPYDGSVLAAYANAVVVTLNYRLGILGFLRPGLERDVVSNFGLLDQIAALHWLRENVGAFGGNPDSVTLVGHGSGAALASFLMTSPVAKAYNRELFQRSILMSGSSLSPMAVSKDPKDITMQVFRNLNCSSSYSGRSGGLVSDVTISRCLKEASLDDLLTVKLNVPMYTTPFGPIVDGVVVPDEPLASLSLKGGRGLGGNTFAKYDVMFGLTESEAFHLFPASLVTYGVNSKEQRGIVKSFLHNTYNVNVDQVLTAVMNEYTDYRHTGENKMVNRDTLLAIFSDARVAAPLVRAASLHCEAKESSQAFLYVFKHVTKKGYYPEVFGSLHGEELAYALGMPLTGGSNHLQQNYTFQEQVLSEVMMHYWANFARTGRPSEGERVDLNDVMMSRFSRPKKVLTSPFAQTLEQIAPTWPPFNPQSQKYMALDLESSVNSFYRPHKMALWNHLVPDLVELSVKERDMDKLPHSRYPSSLPESEEEEEEEVVDNQPPLQPEKNPGSNDHITKITNTKDFPASSPPQRTPTYGRDSRIAEESMPVIIVVLIGIVLLMLNVCACAAVVYQKHRVRQREDNLRRRIKRLSDAGMIRECNDLEQQQQPRTYCVSSSHDNGCNNEESTADDEEESDNDNNTHVAHDSSSVYVITRPSQMMDVTYEEFRNNSLRYSRSMGNNINAISSPQNASKNIAALDVLPPSATQNNHVIYNNKRPQRPPTDSVCYSLKSRFANDTASSSASGSRPPSPIIEVIPVSDYESMYGKLRPIHHHQPHFGVVYPRYNNAATASTLPMASRPFDYAPRGNFAQQMQLPRPAAAQTLAFAHHHQPPRPPNNHWGTLQHPPRPSSGIMQPQMNLHPAYPHRQPQGQGVVSLDARPAVARKRIDFNLNSGLEVVANSSYHHPLEVEDNNKQPLSLSTNKLADCEQEEGEEAKSRKKMPSCLMPKAKTPPPNTEDNKDSSATVPKVSRPVWQAFVAASSTKKLPTSTTTDTSGNLPALDQQKTGDRLRQLKNAEFRDSANPEIWVKRTENDLKNPFYRSSTSLDLCEANPFEASLDSSFSVAEPKPYFITSKIQDKYDDGVLTNCKVNSPFIPNGSTMGEDVWVPISNPSMHNHQEKPKSVPKPVSSMESTIALPCDLSDPPKKLHASPEADSQPLLQAVCEPPTLKTTVPATCTLSSTPVTSGEASQHLPSPVSQTTSESTKPSLSPTESQLCITPPASKPSTKDEARPNTLDSPSSPSLSRTAIPSPVLSADSILKSASTQPMLSVDNQPTYTDEMVLADTESILTADSRPASAADSQPASRADSSSISSAEAKLAAPADSKTSTFENAQPGSPMQEESPNQKAPEKNGSQLKFLSSFKPYTVSPWRSASSATYKPWTSSSSPWKSNIASSWKTATLPWRSAANTVKPAKDVEDIVVGKDKTPIVHGEKDKNPFLASSSSPTRVEEEAAVPADKMVPVSAPLASKESESEAEEQNNSTGSDRSTPKPTCLTAEDEKEVVNSLSIKDANENLGLPKTPILRKVGEKTPTGTLKKSKDRPTSSCKSWCEQYSQTFLAKTIDTPLPDPGPYPDDEELTWG